MAKQKFFLDTSVLRPLERSSSFYGEYLNKSLDGDRYISEYIRKEYIMGFIINMMNFHALLRMGHIKNVADALSVWNNKFNSREVKAVNALVNALLSAHNLDFNDLKEKEKASYLIADYINKCYRLLSKRYVFIGNDNNLCTKSKHKLDWDVDAIQDSFEDFVKKFTNNQDVDKCKISKFKDDNDSTLKAILKANEEEHAKQKKVRDKWSKIIGDLDNPTCKKCASAGDTIISILCPNNMTLAHTDSSFDFLMNVQKKPHIKLKSELAINSELSDKSNDEEE